MMRKSTLSLLLTLLFGVSFSAHAQYGVKTTLLNDDGTVNGAKYEYYIQRPQGSKYVTATQGGTEAIELKTDNASGTTKVKFIFVEVEKNGSNYLALYSTNILKDGSGSAVYAPVTITPDQAGGAVSLQTGVTSGATPYKLTPEGTPALFVICTQVANFGTKDSPNNQAYIQLSLRYDSKEGTYTKQNTWAANNSNTDIQYNIPHTGKFYVWKVTPVTNDENLTAAPPMVFSSTEAGTLGTYSSPVAFTIPTGVKAYKVTSTTPTDNTTISLEEVTGTVPAGKGIIIEQNGSSKVYEVTSSSESVSLETNLEATTSASSSITSTSSDLKTVSTYNVASPVSTTGPIWVENSSSIYGLSGGTFYHLTNSDDATATYITLPPYKAYLVTTSSDAGALKLQFPDGSTTSINAINAEGTSNAAIYDLSGRRVNKTAKGGLYIQNGKKFIAE